MSSYSDVCIGLVTRHSVLGITHAKFVQDFKEHKKVCPACNKLYQRFEDECVSSELAILFATEDPTLDEET